MSGEHERAHMITAGDGVAGLGEHTHDNAAATVLLWARRRGVDPGDVARVCELLDIDPDVAAARHLRDIAQAVLDATVARQQARRAVRTRRRWT